jgi:dihydropyrimidinase
VSAYDLLIRGGTLVDDRGARTGDLAVSGERIMAVTAPGVLGEGDAKRVISAADHLVLPGGIDAHVHFDFALGALISQPYAQGSRAALHGGTTTIVDFAFRAPDGGSLLDTVRDKRADAECEICCDFGLHLIVTGSVEDRELSEVASVVGEGVPTIKVFMNFPDFYPGDGATAELFAELGRCGGTAVVHAENADVIASRTRRLIDAGHRDWRYTDDSRPDWVEAEAVARASALAASAGCPLFVLHVTSAAAAAEVALAQARGLPVFAETCHNYTVFSKDDVVGRPDGANWGNYPPLRPPSNRDALWNALENGTLCHVSSDDYTCPLAIRNINGLDLPTVPSGHNGLETRLSVLYTESVARRGWALPRFAEIASSGIARRLGLWPRKGSLLPGADADIVLFDPDRTGVFTVGDLHTVEYSIWDGYHYAGSPSATIRRGEIVVQDGQWTGVETRGRFLPRPRHPPSRLNGPREAVAPIGFGSAVL